ncbi:DNA topoisomerase 3 [Cyphellophora attinorum]|uniref:DNA topoisomerase n=1 Tax=Cyphellophora attinorum TaxID=1664694 RepID=A0A0N1HWD3_9EURO|nr:DNA topoisomerase 3 [Phialophora attinorum]KPI41916.1 DNA topoisomerase 3 [Phialophora attinorum]
MPPKILCVAEKPAIAKAVAQHLSGGPINTHHVNGNRYVKNYEFSFNFRTWGNCAVVMTSVLGHLTSLEFDEQHRKWNSCQPRDLFEARTQINIDSDKKSIAKNIQDQARYARTLFIWTDCDREGEHIGTEVVNEAIKGNPNIVVKRARFSNTERNHVIQAAHNPIELDERAAKAFPTLGFVVDRYHRVRNFKPETFWLIKLMHKKDGIQVNFNWRRGHLFDRATVTILFEMCLDAKLAKITKVGTRPTSKWRPLPLTTVELQMQGSRFLRMSGQEIMKVAETLYQKGWISYPRTETDQFSRDFDLQSFIRKQIPDSNWGAYAQQLINGAFRTPRSGRNNDQAHPPIHPVNYVVPTSLSANEKKVYEFVVRRFLACCSEDAKGQATEIELEWGGESFHTKGLRVLERNYLDVYPYDKWEDSQQLPTFTLNETFQPTEAKMVDGKTTPPNYLTEPELIGLMDANGIGTDATMAEHIQKIQDRQYASVRLRGTGRTQVREFIPTTLGVALIEGYDNVGLDVSVSKPFLRKEMELKMKAICDGGKTKTEVVQESIEQYREVFVLTQRRIDVLKQSVLKYVVNNGQT